jgi:isopenicillin-N epimerase
VGGARRRYTLGPPGSPGFPSWHTDPVRDAFLLDPGTTHLNHGSFGAVPRVVAEQRQRVLARAEANPMRFFRVESPDLKAHARAVAGEFLGVGPDDLALVRNVSQAVSVVLASLHEQGRLGPGDVVVVHEQGYESVKRAVAWWCGRGGATYHRVSFSLDAGPETVVQAYRHAFDVIRARGDQVRLVVTDGITSPTGTQLPAADICAAAREVGALSLVDAAHVIGQVEARPAETGADFWTGTWHKWAFAPRGTSALWVAEPEREGLRPPFVSWNHGLPFPLPFDTAGTDDYSAWFALGAAVEFWREAGGLEIGERGRALLEDGAAVVDEAVRRTGRPREALRLPPTPAPCLRLVALPDGVGDTEAAADELYEAFSAQRVECQVTAFGGRGWIRLSGAVYNEPRDYERLAEVLPGLL